MKPVSLRVSVNAHRARRMAAALCPLLGMLSLAGAGSAQADGVPEWLDGFNYIVTWEGGQIANIAISGKNGSGRGAPLFDLDSGMPRPAPLRGLPASAAVRLSGINAAGFRDMAVGGQTTLKLPHGDEVFVHDNRYEHNNGDFTWIGHQGENADFRAFFTLGRNGVVIGTVNLPDRTYRIETVAGEVWLIDLTMAGLQPVSLNDDSRTTTGTAARQTEIAASSGSTTVDLLALYTQGLENPVTRINSLVAIANQAYVDSQIPVSLRLVGTESSTYGDNTRNAAALNALTDSSGRLRKTASWRKEYGADLVTLVRPFIRAKQKGCGIAWVNGARHTRLRSKLAFSVVSEGMDRRGSPYYCDDFTLVHEAGHNFGSVHDRQHASFDGRYRYSHGYRLPVSGAGTIMSYFSPRLGYFSNPRILCAGEVCGNARYADNARSISQTAPVVARFRRAVIP
ncbi:MAG: hypothetical protein H6R26_1913 [Proteobacteria bacterium]|nr:hypothetical protein [Pseudomonadota bacterium]